MIAYNTQWLDALAIQRQSRNWYRKGLLSSIQLQEIQQKFESHFYTPNLFIRIGLGIFCWILVSSIFGLLGVTLIENFRNETCTGIVCVFFSVGLFATLEFVIKEKKFYQAGIDDALLYMAVILAIVGISLLFAPLFEKYEALYFLAALPLLLVAAVRYTDTVGTAFSFACSTAIIFYLFKESTVAARFIPFACMVFTAGTYYLVRTQKQNEVLRFWANCLTVLEACCLILFYISGNYFVVEGLGEQLFPGFSIPFSFIFWVFTAVVPFAYIYFGLEKKDRLLLRIGLLLLAISVITFKYYFSLGHYEVTLTIGGGILLAVAYFAINYLKKKPGRYTYTEDRSEEEISLEQTEAILIAQTAGSPTAPDKGFDFGGGKFGGGGAGGNY
ncbi:hypothetical protein Q0590_17775 [Rhodocytophaga aerolata]|uniref:DUF2157 domain-containing protein n=1 Tax=Rhodocytophaga aerolata TaxID=455078 RepID=A0ABT8R7P4_9BACT|nr:hypothetical protein [Rhodocytophaga aerolata]MDO1448128.1 hypothetical protein [Rhodocytophaga aerolata]